MLNTPEAARYRQTMVKKMLQCAPVTGVSPGGGGRGVGAENAVQNLDGGVAGLGVSDSKLAAPPGAGPATGAALLPARGALAALDPDEKEAGSASATRAVSGGAERPANGARGPGRKSLEVMEQAAKALLFRKLRTMRELENGRDESTTDSTDAE